LVGGDFLYLAMLMDRFSRRIVGWDLREHMRETLVITALRAAIRARRPRPGLIHHTDRGGGHRREARVTPASTTAKYWPALACSKA